MRVSDNKTSSDNRLLNLIELGYLRFFSLQNKRVYGIIIALFLLLVLLVISFSSRKMENQALASYESTQIRNELLYGSDIDHKKGMRSLTALAHSSEAALKNGDGILALDLLAHSQKTSPLFKKCLSSSIAYFEQLKMSKWASFMRKVHITPKSDAQESYVQENGSKRDDFLRFYSVITSKSESSETKRASARQFFEKYPELAQQLELVWGEKIERLYDSIENKN